MIMALSVFAGYIGIAMTFGSTNTVSAAVTISNYCTFTTNTANINFGSNIGLGSNTGTETNTILITNTGNSASNVIVYGTNWASGSFNFGVTNTVWSATASTPYASATPLILTGVDTDILLPAPTSGGTTTNTISFGLGIPVGQAPGTYSQTITLSNSC
jgi:hypothetical protein